MSARRSLRLWLGCMLLTAGVTVSALAWLMLGFAVRPQTDRNPEVVLEPPAELGVDALATRLHALKVIDHPQAMRVLLRLLDAEPHLRTTHTLVSAGQAMPDLLRRLVTNHGRPVLRLTLPEGFDRFDIANKLDRFGIHPRAAFLGAISHPPWLQAHDVPGPTAEGYLFPDTYKLRVDSSPRVSLERFVENFEQRVAPLFDEHATAMARLQRELGFDRHDVITLASVVEKEAQRPAERATIAGVFLNRLRDPDFRPHRLQADPTVAYGCRVAPDAAESCADFDGRKVTPAMVRDPDNPYNTYRHEGLPPGPICSPGLASIRAVLEAEAHRYFYFVARGDGSHSFSETLAEHNAAIERSRRGR